MLIYEATFDGAMAEKAHAYTLPLRFRLPSGSRGGCGQAAMTHFSSRYRPEDAAALEAEARTVFAESYAGADLMTVSIYRPGDEDERRVPSKLE